MGRVGPADGSDRDGLLGRRGRGGGREIHGASGSTVTWGSHWSHFGNHQLDFPSRIITEGTTAMRMTTASMRIPPARPRPNSLMTRMPPRMNAPKTRIMIKAAAVIVLPVAARPLRTAVRLSPHLKYSSWIRVIRNTS